MKKLFIGIMASLMVVLSSSAFAKHIYYVSQGFNGPVMYIEKAPKVRYVEYFGPFAVVHKVHRFHTARVVYF